MTVDLKVVSMKTCFDLGSSDLERLDTSSNDNNNKLCGRPPEYAPAPCKLTFDLLSLKLVSESRATWATSVAILVFLGLSVLDLGAMYATDRRLTYRRQTRYIIAYAPYPRGGHNNIQYHSNVTNPNPEAGN